MRAAETPEDDFAEEMTIMSAFFREYPGWGWADYNAAPQRILAGLMRPIEVRNEIARTRQVMAGLKAQVGR